MDGIGDAAAHAQKAGVARTVAVGGGTGRVRLRMRRPGADHVEQMQFVAVDGAGQLPGEFARLRRSEAFRVDAEGVLRLEAGPFVGGRPVAVAERVRLLSRRREVQKELRHPAVERLFQK